VKAIRLFHADDRQWLQILTRLWYFTLHFRMTSQVRASITFYVEYRKSDICCLEVSFWALTTVVKLPVKFLTLIISIKDKKEAAVDAVGVITDIRDETIRDDTIR